MNIIDLLRLDGKVAFLERRGYRTYPVPYVELSRRVLQLETWLWEKGFRKGDRLLIQAPNSADYAALLLAAFRCGVVAVPLEPGATPALRRRVAAEAAPRRVLLARDIAVLGPAVAGLEPSRRPPAAGSGDLAELVYTSGTTGTPKGVMLTHGNITAVVQGLRRGMGLRLRHVSVLPLSHMLEQTAGLLLPLANRSTVLYPNTTRYSELIDLIRYKRISAMTAVPGFLDGLRRAVEARGQGLHRLLGWQFWVVGVGGAALPPDLEDWWRRRVLLLQGYGLTEAAPLVCTNFPLARRSRSLGRPLDGVEVRVRDGELQVRGPNVMKGYYRRPQETAAAFDDGWLRTGDAGELRGGWLYFRGRKKDVIVGPSGLNVYPEDVERELDKRAEESCVIERDGRVHAVVRLSSGDLGRVVRSVNAVLEPHQRIASYEEFHGRLPRTATGKVRRAEVARMVEGGASPPPGEGGELRRLLESVLGARLRNAPLAAQGLDSLRRMELLAAVEERFGVELEDGDVGPATTERDLERLLHGRARLGAYRFGLSPLRHIGSVLFSAFARLFCRIEADAPRKPFRGLVVANHVSAFDVPVLRACLDTGPWAAATLPLLVGVGRERGELLKRLGSFCVRILYPTFPFGPEVGLERSLRFTAHLLDEGMTVFVFPEGGRSPDGTMQEFKEGIGLLAARMDAELLPVRTGGLYEILPPGSARPRSGKVGVAVGRPFRAEGLGPAEAARLIEGRVRRLGASASSPP